MSSTSSIPASGKITGVQVRIVAVVVLGAFLALLNQTVMSPALPVIMADFGIDASTAQWIMSIYPLVSGIMVPVSAYLIDKFSTRKLFFGALVAFAAGTLLCAVAPDFLWLIVGRVLQAAGSGVLMPLVAVVPMLVFPVEKRGTAMGMAGIVMSCAPAAGPVLAGGIIDAWGWRMMFWAMIPLAILVLAVSFFLLTNVGELKRPHLDVPSIVLSTFAFGGLLYGFSSASTLGWGNAVVVGSIVVGVVALAWFIHRQLHIEEPLLQLRALKTPTFAYSAVIVTVVNSALAVGSVILPIYLQNVLGLTAFETGILMTPGAVATIFLSPVSGMLFDRFGPRVIAIMGLTGLTASLAALSLVDDKTMVAYLVAFYVIQSSGLTLANMPVTTWGINALPNDMIAHGNAISNTGRQVGGAVSTALIVTVMTMVTAANAEAGPVLSTAAGIDVAYGISAAVASVALVIAVLKVRNVKKQAVASPASRAEAPLEIEMEEAREGAAR